MTNVEQATEEAARQQMALSFDVLWRIGRNHIDDPRGMCSHSSDTCSRKLSPFP